MKITTRYLAISGSLMLIATAIGSYALFTYFYDSERTAFFNRLEMKIAALTAEQNEIFDMARESQLSADKAFKDRIDVWSDRSDITEQFTETFAKQSDGTYRSFDADFDGALSEEGRWIYGIGAFVAPDIENDTVRQAQLLAGYDTIVSFGEAALFWVDNFYYFTPQNDLVIFAPQREDRLEYYRKTAPADFNFQQQPVGKHVLPENNPDRVMQCTELQYAVFDQTKSKLTSGCHTPVDLNGAHIGAFGVTFPLNGWLSEAIATSIEGEKPFIIQSDGQMIAHEELIDRRGGKEFARQFSVELQADDLVSAITNTGDAAGTIFFKPWNAYVSYARFSGPSWYYVARVSKDRVSAAALASSLTITFVTFVLGLALTVLLATVLRRVIAKPLEKLTAETDQDILRDGTSFITGAERTDEIGMLARSFQQRDSRYKELLGTLDDQVQVRTEELINALESAKKADQAKSFFLANVSHEIRTPLNGIVGMAQVLAKSDLTDKDHKKVDVIKTASFSLLDVINDVLDLSKIESGSLEFEAISFSIEELVSETVSSFEHKAVEKGIGLDIKITDNSYGIYRSDPTKIKQVLTNLISNALKFTTAGSVGISVNAQHTASELCTLEFEVSDSGIGLTEDSIENLFQPFMQADSSTTRKYGGTGLGLAICKRIVEGLNGNIEVESELGTGSIFTFSIPVVFEAEQNSDSKNHEGKRVEESLKNFSILVAEDNEINRLVIEEMLGSVVRRLTFVENGEEAVAAWESGDVDLILMDIQMPLMDGVEATRKIRALESKAGSAPVPIIALTANAFSEQGVDYITNGMNAHLAKPIDFDVLCELMISCTNPKANAA